MGRAAAFPTLLCLALSVPGGACAGFGWTGVPPADPPVDGDAAGDDVDGDDGEAADDDGDGDDDDSEGDGSGRAPLHPDRPGGWTRTTLVFSQVRAVEDGQNDDWVQLGWLELDEDGVGAACDGSGPRATRVVHRWAHDEDYPRGDCDEDRKDGVDFRRWDHSPVTVDACPGAGAWVEADGAPSPDPFLVDCPAHVPAGFGDPEHRRTWEGWYAYDAAERSLILRYDVNGSCRKEYYRDLTHDAGGALLGMRLDGARSGDTSATWRGVGGTHGYAYGSSTPMANAVPLEEGMQAIAERSFLMDAWRFREGREDGAPLQQYQSDEAVGYQPVSCGADAWFDHSCVGADGHAPYLGGCAGREPEETAYLRFWVDPFPGRDSREHLFWAWHAHHAPNWTGCYHRGSHSNPLLQVLDADGVFRGYVGVEIQRSARTDGFGQVPADAWQRTDYRVFRWIEGGFQESAPEVPSRPTSQ